MAYSGKKIKQKNTKNNSKEILRELLPIAKAFGLWILLVVIVVVDYTNHRWFSMLFIDFTTQLTYLLAKLFHIPVQLGGSGLTMMTTLEVNYRNITIDHYPMLIELECSAYHTYLAIVSLVVFSSWKLKHKFSIGATLIVILSIVNSFRIIILGVLGQKYPALFNVLHDYIWNILMVIVILIIWDFSNRKFQQVKEG